MARFAAAARVAVLVAGGLAPLAATAAWLASAGVWSRFWFWTVSYGGAYASITAPAEGVARLRFALGQLLPAAPGLWSAAGIGAGVLVAWPAVRRWRGFLAGLAVMSFLAVCPGLYFRGHYFLLLMPALALLAGVGVAGLTQGLARWRIAEAIPGLLICVALVQALWTGPDVYFRLAPVDACRAIYGDDPFPEAVAVGRYLREHTPPGARIAILGSEPEIWFYARRRAATPYL